MHRSGAVRQEFGVRKLSYIELSAVVPCYNEEESLAELFRRLDAACANVASRYEILLIDDGSKDRTWELISGLAEANPQLVGVRLARNHGHQLALSAGLSVCRGQRVLIIDADLQDPPELLPKMMEAIDEGAEVVYGKRTVRQGETQFKKFTAQLFYRLLNRLVDIEIPLDTGDFRLMTRKALDFLLSMPEQHRFIRGMVAWIGLKQVPLEYVREERFAGETKYPIAKMIGLAIDAITGFSVRPLRISTYLGFWVAGLAALLLAYSLFSWAFFQTVSGWTSLIGVVLALGAIQLVVLGVIGEYLGRLFLEAKRRPLFLIDEIKHSGEIAQTLSPPLNNGKTDAYMLGER